MAMVKTFPLLLNPIWLGSLQVNYIGFRFMGAMATEGACTASVAGPLSSRSTARAAWQQPTCRAMMIEDSETGVNSTTDATATFS
jgi:hypothetical protein